MHYFQRASTAHDTLLDVVKGDNDNRIKSLTNQELTNLTFPEFHLYGAALMKVLKLESMCYKHRIKGHGLLHIFAIILLVAVESLAFSAISIQVFSVFSAFRIKRFALGLYVHLQL